MLDNTKKAVFTNNFVDTETKTATLKSLAFKLSECMMRCPLVSR